MMTNNERSLSALVEKELCGLVSEKRLMHVLSVRSTATMLCDFFEGLEIEMSRSEVELAALLHDITKCMDQQKLCSEYGIELSEDDKASPETLHALTGACFAKSSYGVNDKVCSAIKKHTTADEEMGLLDKIIFVSDYCEQTRTHPECKASREELLSMIENTGKLALCERVAYASRRLDYITCEILAKTIKYLDEKNLYIHRKTISAYFTLLSLHDADGDFAELAVKYGETAEKYR